MSNKKKNLERAFPGTKIVKYVTVTPGGVKAGLTPKLRWLWSVMVWRYRFHPASKAALSRWSGLCRTRTLPGALTKLQRLGMVRRVGQKYMAVKPAGELEWLSSFKLPDGKIKIAYNWAVHIRGVDIIDGLVKAADAERVRSASLLAARFGVCRQTITAARKRIAGIGLDRPSKVKDNPVVMTKAVEQPTNEPEVTTIENQKQTIQETIKAFELSGMQGASNAERLAHQHGITEPDTVAVLSRLTATVLKGLAYKEQSQIIGTFVKRFGTGEGLEDYLYGKLPAWTMKYGSGILSVESFLQAT